MKTFAEKSSSKTDLTRSPTWMKPPPILAKQHLTSFPGGNPFIQPKLKIGQPNDKYEQEADRVADQVMSMPEPMHSSVNDQRSLGKGGRTSPLIQRQTDDCPDCNEKAEEVQRQVESEEEEAEKEEEEEESVQAKHISNQSPPMPPGLQNQIQSMKGGGEPLPPSTRSFFEPRFGRDFGNIRVHTGAKAEEAAKAVHAKAFTIGESIVFGSGEYAPSAYCGAKLIAHELVHNIQQTKKHRVRCYREYPMTIKKPPSSQITENFQATPISLVQRVGLWESILRIFGAGTYSEQELHKYLRAIREKRDIENDIDSDNKAEAIVNHWKTGKSNFVLTPSIIILLIREMQVGWTDGGQEKAILELLERCENHQLSKVFGANGIDPDDLEWDFDGANYIRLHNFYNHRFKGGTSAVLAKEINPIGKAVPLGVPLSERELKDDHEGDKVIESPCEVKKPENCHTYEQWISLFFDIKDTFDSASGHKVIGVKAPSETAVDPKAAASERRPTLKHSKDPNTYIDKLKPEWLEQNLPQTLIETAYQLPSDCADIAVILRHVWLVAHRRTEIYKGWLCGARLEQSRSKQIKEVIVGEKQVWSKNVKEILRPYTDSAGTPILSYKLLRGLLHPGDVMVWKNPPRGGRYRGHTQTITRIFRDEKTGNITKLVFLQGNQPIGEDRYKEIVKNAQDKAETEVRDEYEKKRKTQGISDKRIEKAVKIARRKAARSIPSESTLRSAPGRRIEKYDMEISGDPDVDNVWTRFEGKTTLVAAGPPGIGTQPRKGKQLLSGLENWITKITSVKSINELQSVFEASLLESRALIEGNHADTLTSEVAKEFGQAAGLRFWQLSKQTARDKIKKSVREKTPKSISERHLQAEELGEESHYRPMHHLVKMLKQLGTSSSSPLTSQRFSLIAVEFEQAARGISTVEFHRKGISSTTNISNIIITGFDPFKMKDHKQYEPEYGYWNPSGAAVLQMDGIKIPVEKGLIASVEGIVLPVRYDTFRAGLVESSLESHIDNVDGIITVSMGSNIKTNDPSEIERYAIGIHHLNNGKMEAIPPSPGSGSDPGPAIIESKGPIQEISMDVGLTAKKREGDTCIRFKFIDFMEAKRALKALELPSQDQDSEVVEIDNMEAIKKIVKTMERSVQGYGITFRVGNQSFQARILSGPGGYFLSNEVAYRVLRMLGKSKKGSKTTSFHVHTPLGELIPQEVGSKEERTARYKKIQQGRELVTRLVKILKKMVISIAKRIRGSLAPIAEGSSE